MIKPKSHSVRFISLLLHLVAVLLLVILLDTTRQPTQAQGPSPSTFFDFQNANLVLGHPDFISDIGGTSQSEFNGSVGVAVDPTTGKIFVSDYNNHRVLRFPADAANGALAEAVLGQSNFTSNVTGTSPSGMFSPISVFVDGTGRLWVADYDNNRVLRFDNAASKTSGANADGVLGQVDFVSSVITTTQNGMAGPADVFVDAGGRLWVAEFGNNRVLRFDNAAAKPNGANADGVLGQPDFQSTGFATTQNGMKIPMSVFVDTQNRLWVADRNNNRVLRFDNGAAKLNGANADGVLGQVDFISSLSAVAVNGMNGPGGMTGDATGRIMVADTYNNRVLVFDNAATLGNGGNASHVLGQPDFVNNTANNGGVSAQSLNFPLHLSIDAGGHLWVGDTYNNRVLRYASSSLLLPLILR